MGGHPRTQDSQFTVVWGQRGSEGPKVLLGLGDAGASSRPGPLYPGGMCCLPVAERVLAEKVLPPHPSHCLASPPALPLLCSLPSVSPRKVLEQGSESIPSGDASGCCTP